MTTIGWDVSTSAIGICVRREGEPDSFHVIFPKGKTPLEKHRSAVEQVSQFMSIRGLRLPGMPEVVHVVEERLGGFTGGLTTKQTLMALAAMNAVVSLELSRTGKVVHILPVTVKAITKLKDLMLEGEEKKDTVVRLARQVPNFPYAETKAGNWVKGTDDMADAWLLAEAWSRVMRGEATLGSSKKARGGKGKARGAKDRRKEEG